MVVNQRINEMTSKDDSVDEYSAVIKIDNALMLAKLL